jgi:hypothetical protein
VSPANSGINKAEDDVKRHRGSDHPLSVLSATFVDIGLVTHGWDCAALCDERKDIMQATLVVRSCELYAEFCFSIPA